MTAPLYIALRFATHRKRALLLSLVGVVFGVGIFICTQAQTQGFAQFFIDSTIGSNGALVVRSRFQPRHEGMLVTAKSGSALPAARRNVFEGINNASEIMRVSRQFSNVVACSPVLRGSISARAGFETTTADLYGIDPVPHLRTTDLEKQIIDGSFNDFRNNTTSVILGYKLAELLEVGPGDTVQLLSPGGDYWRFTVAAIARSGVGAIDFSRVYTHARVAQRLLKKPYEASMIIYKLRDPERAPALANHFENLFQHTAQSWQEREEGNLQIFSTLRISAAITVSLIILLAGFGIFNVLTMSVLSKVREIAILRSMGYRRIDISAIFLWQGALIAGVGSLLGCVLGAVMTLGISKVPIHIRGLLYTNHFLVVWDWQHYFWATVLAIVAVFIASYVPARRAAQLQPVDTLRGSSL
jgi:lipoprotein-releasing system permease protein